MEGNKKVCVCPSVVANYFPIIGKTFVISLVACRSECYESLIEALIAFDCRSTLPTIYRNRRHRCLTFQTHPASRPETVSVGIES